MKSIQKLHTTVMIYPLMSAMIGICSLIFAISAATSILALLMPAYVSVKIPQEVTKKAHFATDLFYCVGVGYAMVSVISLFGTNILVSDISQDYMTPLTRYEMLSMTFGEAAEEPENEALNNQQTSAVDDGGEHEDRSKDLLNNQ